MDITCCDERKPAFSATIEDLAMMPDSAICCMAELAYTVSCAAAEVYGKASPEDWWKLSSKQRHYYAKLCKNFLVSEAEPKDTFEQVMNSVVVTMTTR